MRVPRSAGQRWSQPGLRAASRVAGLLALSVLSGCAPGSRGFLDPHGPVAAAQRAHLIEVAVLVMIAVLPVLVLTPLVAWRYRYRGGSAAYRPKWSFSWPFEIAIWGVPVAIVAVLGVLLWRSTHALDPYVALPSDQPPLHVEVVGYDWKWLFIYPDLGIASVGELAFPVDRPLALELTSATVMQSFFVPALGSQIYVMGGMVTRLHLAADAPGTFLGENTQFNGRGFHRQQFSALAMAAGDFRAWTDRVRAEAVPLTVRAYEVLAQRSTVEETRKALAVDGLAPGIVYLKGVPTSLFHAVVAATMSGMAAPAGQVFDGADATVSPAGESDAHQ